MKNLPIQTGGLALAMGAALALVACDDSELPTGAAAAGTTSVTLSLALRVGPSLQAPAPSVGSATLAPLGGGIDLTSVQLLLEELELEGEVGRVEFETGPLAVSLVLGTTPAMVQVAASLIPAGIYDELDLDIDVPEDSDLGSEFADFLAPSLASVLISGTFDPGSGTSSIPFDLRLAVEAELDVDIVPALEVKAGAPTNITLLSDIADWFQGSGGSVLDPTDPANEAQIIANIRSSFKAFEDQDLDAEEEESLSFAELKAIVDARDMGNGNPTRLEIESNGTLVAREVEIAEGDEVMDDEEIESRITAISPLDPVTGTRTITLELGDLEIEFSAAGTEFEDERGPGDGEEISFTEFVNRVEEALGLSPPVQLQVEVERPAQNPAQAPTDASFFASEIQLQDEEDQSEIDINVDTRHLMESTATPPDGTIQVLGLTIEVDVTNRITEIEEDSSS